MSTTPRFFGLKHALDRIAAIALLLPLAPVFVFVAIAIKLDDGGDVFFRQTRAGLEGNPFNIWKFRTMVPNATDLGGGFFPEGMQLVTRVGRFLRKTSIDELPQLFNIATGQMSFVGPRPTLLEQVARYTPHQRRRLHVKPGVTGWAQLHGRSEIPWSRRIEYDVEYVTRASLGFDLRILIRTVPVVLFGKGNRATLAPDDGTDDLRGSRQAEVRRDETATEQGAAQPQVRTSAGAFSAGAR